MPKTQLELLTENEKFEALFQHSSQGILIVNQQAEIILANKFLLQLFGYEDQHELTGKKIETLIPARFRATHQHHRDGYMSNPKRRPMGSGMDLFGVRKNGDEFPVEVSLGNYRSEDASFVIAFVSDISQRKQIESEMFRQQEELAAINRKIEELNDELEAKVITRTMQLQEAMEELEKSKDVLSLALSREKELGDMKSRFVSMASHEFRTPLSTILSSASLVARYTQTEDQDKRDKHIQRIKSAVNNLTDILNEFLSIGKIEDGKVVTHYSRFNVRDLLVNICNELQGITKPGQRIQINYTGNETLELDITLLRNVFINLLSNAIKFSPENGLITISAKVDECAAEFEIRDTGIGISAEDQAHLFERFFRAKNATNIQGTGLGLHIVGKYVELMNGSIACESELEKGTAFVITFTKTNTTTHEAPITD